MLAKSRKLVNFSAIPDKKEKRPSQRARECKNAEKARLGEDFQATIV